MHKPVKINNLCLSFPHKTCFDNFTHQVHYGNRIAIIGRNGSGKSTLLKILYGIAEPTSGDVDRPHDALFGYVPQVIEDYLSLSGGQRFNKVLTKTLNSNPNILLLDEPTNHLDHNNRKSLMRMLRSYPATLIIVSHDIELLNGYIDTLWHIDNEKIRVFSGNYDDYMRETHNVRQSLELQLSRLNRQKKETHYTLMKEQKRAANSRSKGEKSIAQKKWPTVVSQAKAYNAQETSGRKKAAIHHKKQALNERISDLRLPEIIMPTFSLQANDIENRIIVSISDGSVAYSENTILTNINLSLHSKDRIAIIGDNGSGKSTLVKAILNDASISKKGEWHAPKGENIGYLDQHYMTLSLKKSVFETISELVPTWSHIDVRRHLTDFLFRKPEEVNALINQLSGGEKARLSLAKIAAKTPKLLILDEITNNLDLETRQHIIEVLCAYPGAIIVISHDSNFLSKIDVKEHYHINQHTE